MKIKTKLILGILSAVICMSFIVVWDLIIKENIESTQVVVVKPGIVIQKHDVIQRDDLLVEKRNRATIIEGYVQADELKKIIGKQAAQTLVGNQIISHRYIDIDEFIPNPEKGEAIRPIPNQWIYALPATLRRKDTIDIYLVSQNTDKDRPVHSTSKDMTYVGLSPEQEQSLAKQADADNKEDEMYEEEREKIAEIKGYSLGPSDLLGEEQQVLNYREDRTALLNSKGLTEDQWQDLVMKSDIPVLVDIPVAYAKDGSGNEIHSGQQESVSDSKRLTSTGTIVNLELLLNQENHSLLMNYVQNGYKLYITYN